MAKVLPRRTALRQVSVSGAAVALRTLDAWHEGDRCLRPGADEHPARACRNQKRVRRQPLHQISRSAGIMPGYLRPMYTIDLKYKSIADTIVQ